MLLEARDITVRYGDSTAVESCSLAVKEGMVTAILGRNGMGKTTLLRALVGQLRPASGSIRFRGAAIDGKVPEEIFDYGLTYVPQGRRVFPSLSTWENLQISARQRPGVANWELEEVLDLFPGMRDRRGVRAGSLSGGEQQKLAIMRALVGNGQLLVMDEPTEGLDQKSQAVLQKLIVTLLARQTTVLMVEQKLDFAVAVAERFYMMSGGSMVVDNVERDRIVGDDELVAQYLGVKVV